MSKNVNNHFNLKIERYKKKNNFREIKNFTNLMAPHLLIEYGYILIHTCIPAFVITSVIKKILNFPSKFKNLNFFTFSLDIIMELKSKNRLIRYIDSSSLSFLHVIIRRRCTNSFCKYLTQPFNNF